MYAYLKCLCLKAMLKFQFLNQNQRLNHFNPRKKLRMKEKLLRLTNLDPKQFGYQNKLDLFFKCVQGNHKKNLWYLDGGCSRHMTGDSSLLTKFVEKAGPNITFGDDNKGYTMGYGLISK